MAKSKPHHAHTFSTLEAYLEYCTGVGMPEPDKTKAERWARKTWKKHIEKNGNIPMIVQCAVCSGQEFKQDVKHGRYKKARPGKTERDEQRGKE